MYVDKLFSFIKLTTVLLIFMQSALSQDKPEMEKLSWILDKWVSKDSGNTSYESWVKISDDLYEGSSNTVKDNVITFEEKLKIQKTDSGIFYIADVKQNTEPVQFRLTSVTGDEAVFENPEHDFPKIISYKNEDGNLHAWIEGRGKNGEPEKIDFFFYKMR